MPRFALEEHVTDAEMQRRLKAELDVELLQTRAPRLLAAIDVIETMMGLGFGHRGNHRDGTFIFVSGESEVFIRRDWAYAGVAYHVCLDADCRRISSARQLRRAVRGLVFRRGATVALTQALHHRLGAAAAIRVLGADCVGLCLAWV